MPLLSQDARKKKIIIPILFMVLILLLATMPMGEIKINLRNNFILVFIKSQIQKWLNIEITFSTIGSFLHIPFFALLAFLWMRFFVKRKIGFKSATIYVLVITALFSMFEESCQLFTSREASFGDLFLNFVGCLSGIGTYRLSDQYYKVLKSKKYNE